MFLGEALCLIVYMVKLRTNRINDEYTTMGVKPRIPVWLIAIPASLDFVASNISYFALNMIPSSVWQLSKGGAIITTAIFTRILLKRILTKRRIFGCVLATVGITIVGLSVVIFSDADAKEYVPHEEAIGIAMVIGSLVFTGLQICYEERLFRQYTLDVFQLVGMEGIFGLAMNVVLVVVFMFLKCPWEEAKCGGG
jgi:drug/metabolite transporter (DMT)-like permease